MHPSTQLSDRRPRSAREIVRHPVLDAHNGYDEARIIPYARAVAPRRAGETTIWTRSSRAAAAFWHLATESVPNFLLAIGSLIVSEAMTGCAVYAEAMYGIPLAAAEPQPAEIPLQPGVSLTLVHTGDDYRRREPKAQARSSPARTATALVVQPDQGRTTRLPWYAPLVTFVMACRSRMSKARARRRVVAELRQFDERSLRDIGLTAADIEYFAWHGEWRE
jgi:uncharacterized protein YjiS (DUF1127 family)